MHYPSVFGDQTKGVPVHPTHPFSPGLPAIDRRAPQRYSPDERAVPVAARKLRDGVTMSFAGPRVSRRKVLAVLATSLAPLTPFPAQGQSQQTIRLYVPFSAGTGPDLLARILGEELRQRWNQPVIVENKPGASGNIGTQAAAQAAAGWPDPAGDRQYVRDECEPLSLDPLRSRKGFRADRRDRNRRARARRSSFAQRQHVLRADRAGPQQAGRRSTTLPPAAARRSISPWSC